jgi:glycosyltransferase involved in cell wall biosynthesis
LSPGRPRLPSNPFGKDIANFELFQSLLLYSGLDELCFLLPNPLEPDAMRQILIGSRTSPTRIKTASFFNTDAMERCGVLFRGKADLADLAWQRRQTKGDRAYSLVGLIHTIAPPAIRQYIARCTIAPVEPWDALICTSPVVRNNIQQMFEAWNDYLGGRLGGPINPRRMPMLPVVPLGVDCRRLAAAGEDGATRAELRRRLEVPEDEALILWVGRLSPLEKAFPQAMFQAVEEASRRTKQHVHFAMVGWFPDPQVGPRLYGEAARLHAPSVTVHMVDGNDRKLVNGMWGAGDIFLSLVDNIQETFGITLPEAMAAGLPIVASDWDGYRATVEPSVEGFLIPTMGGPPDSGASMLLRHVLGMDTYQHYVGTIAQCTAVNVARAAEALAALISHPELRRKMGHAGRNRALSTFDWPIVIDQFTSLFDELAEIRCRSTGFGLPGAAAVKGDPVKDEPFSSFAAFATETLTDTIVLRARTGIGASPSSAFQGAALNRFGEPWRANLQETEAAYALLRHEGELSVGQILSRFPGSRRAPLQASLLWMCKLGLLDWGVDK